MLLTNWLTDFFQARTHRHRRTAHKRRPQNYRLQSSQLIGQTEVLEDRTLLSAAELISVVDPALVAESGSGFSAAGAISADGRFLVFTSDADNLVLGDSNGKQDVFVRDLVSGTTTLVSVNSSGTSGNNESLNPVISADGRMVAFESGASDLVAGDNNGIASDVFVRDLIAETTTLVSVNTSGSSGNAGSTNPVISADGSTVAFESFASELVSRDLNGAGDVFIRNLATGTTTLVSVNNNDESGNGRSLNPVMTADGSTVAFQSYASDLVSGDSNGTSDAFVRDLVAGTTMLVSVNTSGNSGNGFSDKPVISADGSNVAFASDASDLVSDDSNGTRDVFVHNLVAGTTTLVSVNSSGTSGNSSSDKPVISADGSTVAFESDASDLVSGDGNGTRDVFVRDLVAGTSTLVNVTNSGNSGNSGSVMPTISGDGRKVAFRSFASDLVPGDDNGTSDIFVRDLVADTTILISINASGNSANNGTGFLPGPIMSADGSAVVFVSDASDLVEGDFNGARDVFVRNLAAGTTALVSRRDPSLISRSGVRGSTPHGVTADGRYVVFSSNADNLVPGDSNRATDVFVRDLVAGTTALVSVNSSGESGNGSSINPVISADGSVVSFESFASDLVSGDSNGVRDVFVRDLVAGTTTLASVNSSGASGNGVSASPVISADGNTVAFQSFASDLVPGDSNGNWDVFVRNVASGTTTLVSVNSSGSSGNGFSSNPVISADARSVAFESVASNLVSGDTNGTTDVFVRDLVDGTTMLVSVNRNGNSGNLRSLNPVISADGSTVAFESDANDLILGDSNNAGDVFVRDLTAATTSLISVNSSGSSGNRTSFGPVISADGQNVAFVSDASDLVAGDSPGSRGVFIRNLASGTTELVSVNSIGNDGDGWSSNPAISADGGIVAFQSRASDLTSGNNNGLANDIFIRDVVAGTTTLVSINSNGSSGNNDSTNPVISANGSTVISESDASDLVEGDLNGLGDAFAFSLDVDGVPAAIEDAAPNGGDGNGDGILDSNQDNVASLPNAVDAAYVAFESPTGSTLVEVQAVEVPPPGLPSEAETPVGTFEFSVAGLSAGAPTIVVLYMPAGTDVNQYWKFDNNNGWYEFNWDGATGATFQDMNDDGATDVVLHFIDGGRGDDDGLANGVVVDPGAPVSINSPPTALDDSVSTDEDTPLLIDVLANDTDAEDNIEPALTVALTSPSAGTLTNNGDGTFTFTFDPASEFEYLGVGEADTISFDYQIEDAYGETGTATVTITITGANDTEVTLDADNNLVITDTHEVTDDNLTIHWDAANAQVIISDSNSTLNSAIAGTTGSGSNTLAVPFASFSGIIVDTGDGDDTITLTGSGPGLAGGLTLITGAGFDVVTVAANLSFADAVAVNADAINVAGLLSTSGAGTIDLVAERNIALATGVEVVTEAGAISLSANAQATPTSGTFIGIDMQGSRVASESGSISLFGRGGDTGTGNFGVMLDGAAIESTGTGASAATIDIVGRGGDAVDRGYGVFMWHAGAAVSSIDGDINVHGIGGAGSDVLNLGVFVTQGGTIASTGTGNITVAGEGGAGSSSNHGLQIVGLNLDSFVSTIDGDITLSGIGADNSALGVNIGLRSFVHATGAGNLSITGATAGQSGIAIDSVVATATGAIDLNTNSLVIQSGGTLGAAAGSGIVRIRPVSDGTFVQFGSDKFFNRLALSNAELGRITAAVVEIGSPDAGSIVFATEAVSVNGTLKLVTGGSVDVFSGGGLTVSELAVSAVGNVSLGSAMNVDTLAISSSGGSAVLTDATGFTVGEVAGQAGITAAGSIALAADGGLIAIKNTIVAGGGSGIAINADAINVTGLLSTSGAGAIDLVAERNIALASGASITTVDGDLTLSANMGATPSSGNFVGIDINAETVQTTGTGNLSLTGRGGDDAAGSQHGVWIRSGGQVQPTATSGSGNVLVTGFGGASTGNSNYGVHILGTTSRITSGGGDVLVNGTGGGTGASGANHGAYVVSGQVTSGGTGTVRVEGTGGNTTGSAGNDNHGVYMENSSSRITSNAGHVYVMGLGGGAGSSSGNVGTYVLSAGVIAAGGSGSVSVVGVGGNTTGSGAANMGVRLSTLSRITSAGGNVSVSGTGGGAGNAGTNYGVSVGSAGEITAGGTGSVTVEGSGGNTTGSAGSANIGVSVQSTNGRITSGGGDVSVIGTGGGSGTSGNNFGVHVTGKGAITAGGLGNIAVVGTGGNTTGTAGSTNYGVYVENVDSRIASSGGDVSVMGMGGGSAGSSGSNIGISVNSAGEITAAGIGNVTVQGTGGNNSGSNNHGVRVTGPGSQINAESGDVSIIGTGGGGTGAFGFNLTSSGALNTTGTGDMSITADRIHIESDTSINASVNTITLVPETNGTAIDLGGADAPGTLGLTDAELSRITAGRIAIGHPNGGSIWFSDDITLASDVGLIAGGSITFNTSQLNAGAHNVTLVTGTTRGVTTSDTAGTDIVAADLAITAGSLGIGSSSFPLRLSTTGLTASTPSGGQFLVATTPTTITAGGLSAGAGTITLADGTFALGGPERIDEASKLDLSSGAVVRLNGFDETVGELTGRSGSRVVNGSATSATLTLNLSSLPGHTTFAGIFGGPGEQENNFGIVKNGRDQLLLHAVHTYDGITTINAGSINLIQAATLGSTAGRTVVNSGATLNILTTTPVFDDIVVSGTGFTTFGALNGSNGALLVGDVTLTGDTRIGKFGTGAAFTISGAISDDGAGFGLEFRGTEIERVVVLSGTSTFGGATILRDVLTLQVDGSIGGSGVELVDGSRLTGSGEINAPIIAPSGSKVSPGPAVAKLATGDLTLYANSTYTVELNGPDAGIGYDQLDVTGTVEINGANLAVTRGFLPENGASFTLIANDGADAVVGTFAGLPEGAVLTVDGRNFIISYVGGDGNDVEMTAVSTIVTWDAGGADNHWTTAENWANDIAPLPGDALVFQGAGVATVNDFEAGTAFRSISFVDHGFRLSGNAITLDAAGGTILLTTGVDANGLGTQTISLPVTLGAPGTIEVHAGSFLLTSAATVDTNGYLLTFSSSSSQRSAFQGAVTGTGGLTVNATKPGGLGLLAVNTYSGWTTVESGSLSVGAARSTLTPGSSIGTLGDEASGTVVKSGATLDIGTSSPVTEHIILEGLGFVPAGGSALRSIANDVELAGDVTLLGDTQIGVTFSDHTFTISGNISGDFGITARLNFGQSLVLTGANTYSGPTHLVNAVGTGTLEVNGSLATDGAVNVHAGTALGGEGTIGGPVVVNTGGTLSPGVATGILNTGSVELNVGSTFSVELNGSTAGTEHDQVKVTGTVNISGANLQIARTFDPAIGTQFTLIANDGTDPVSGIFAALAEGAVISVDGVDFVITYAGGDGNDVVLTRNTPPTAHPGGPYIADEGASFTLDASASSDPDEPTAGLTFEWDLDYDGLTFDVDATGIAPSVSFPDNSEARTIAVRVTDSAEESHIASTTLTVKNVAPTLNSVILTSAVIDEGGSVTVSGTFTDPGTIDTHNVIIDWGDGAPRSVLQLTSGERSFDATHQYLDDPSDSPSDAYTVRALVADDDASLSGVLDQAVDPGSFGFGVDSSFHRAQTFQVGADGLLAGVDLFLGGSATERGDLFVDILATVDGVPHGEALATQVISEAVIPTTLTAELISVDFSSSGIYVLQSDVLAIVLRPAGPAAYALWKGQTTDTYASGNAFSQSVANGAAWLQDADRDMAFRTHVSPRTVEPFSLTVNNVAPQITGMASGILNENESVNLRVNFTDPGTVDQHTALIDWGDGNSELVTIPVGERTFSILHQYLDDSPRSDDAYEVQITLTDDDGGSHIRSIFPTVKNVAPEVEPLSLSASEIDENGSITINGTFNDPGTLDTHEILLDWGDASTPTFISLTGGERAFTATHQYLDDGMYTITADVTDDDAGVSAAATALITVQNVAPTASIAGPSTGVRNKPFAFTLGAADPSPIDQAADFTYAIDWDSDGIVDQTVVGPNGHVVEHAFDAKGTYVVSITATDKDELASAFATHTLEISAAAVDNQGNLNAGGGNVRAGKGSIILEFLDADGNIEEQLTFDESQVTGSLIIYGSAGNDVLVVDSALTLPVELHGGVGNDILQGGGGENLLIGGDGDDVLIGGTSTNTLDGGDGDDVLQDGGGVNTIIGGSGSNTFIAGDGMNTFEVADGSGTDNADPPQLIVTSQAAGEEGAAIPLPIWAGLSDTDGSESLTLTIAGLPVYAILSLGHRDSNGDWVIESSGTTLDLSQLTLTAGDNGLLELTITATTTETANGTTSSTVGRVQVTIANVAPQNVAIAGPVSGVRGQTLSYSGSFTDPGSADTHSFTWQAIDSASALVASGSDAAFHFIPEASGEYSVVLVVTDDDGDQTTGSLTLLVTATAFMNGELYVGGTIHADDIRVNSIGNTGQVDVVINGSSAGTISPTGRIVVFGQAGDDDIQIAGSITNSAWLYGGDGNDRLKGGGGHDVLFGEAGDDLLVGGSGRDLLVGGQGSDRIVGNADDDILIAGWLNFANQDQSLLFIMNEWTSDNDYHTRIENLNDKLVSSVTVKDSDEDRDTLTGSAGDDWFFFDWENDKATDLKNEVFANDLDWIMNELS